MNKNQEGRPSYRDLFLACESLAFQRDKLQAELDTLKKEKAELIEWLNEKGKKLCAIAITEVLSRLGAW